MKKEDIDKIVWWIPFKKLRNSIRNILEAEEKINNNNDMLLQYMKKVTPQAYLNNIEIHLAEHCNFACYSCTHFSQLAEEEYYDINIFEKDIKRLYELSNGLVKNFYLLGGEPLLNKNCKEYFYIIRKYFKESRVCLLSNGILLLKQDESFWKACNENNILISITKYPIKLDWEKMKEVASEKSVNIEFYNDGSIEEGESSDKKYSYRALLDENGNADSFKAFINCFMSNGCVQLVNGKLFPCNVAANIRHFNKYFNKKLELTSIDYIDIYEAKNYNEILQFLAKPIPFCRYCLTYEWQNMGKWLPSKRDVNEYIQTRPDQTSNSGNM